MSPTKGQKDWAVKILARELSNRGYVNLANSSNLDSIVRESYHSVHRPNNRDGLYHSLEQWTFSNYSKVEKLQTETEEKLIKKNRYGSNYVFVESSFGEALGKNRYREMYRYGMHFTRTFMAIIGQNEETLLRKLFYRERPAHIEEAVDILGLDLFDDLYETYLDTEAWAGLLEGVKTKERARIAEFAEFVLQLPEKDRNADADSTLFSTRFINQTHLLLQMYGRGDEAFARFAEQVQKKCIDKVAAIVSAYPTNIQSTNLNAWLFEQGYHGVNIPYLNIYLKDTKEFMDYFGKQDEGLQEQIIETLMQLDMSDRNGEVDTLLEEEYQSLLERVGIQYVGES